MKTLRRANKIFAVLSSILMLVQPIFPVFQYLTPQVFAQEATPTVTPVPTPDPTITTTPDATPTATPTEEVTPVPTETVTPTPTIDVTPTATPDATPTATPTEEVTPAPTDQTTTPATTSTEPPKETGPPAEQGQILDGASVTAMPSPTVTPEPTEDGQLQAVVLQNVEANSLNLDNIDPSNSASLTTDKADYAPTDTAIITGTGFKPNHDYKITVSSVDEPATSTTDTITTDADGAFVYAYQLDGIYRPNYKVSVTNNGGKTIAATTFTDSNPAANLDQWGNEAPIGWQNGNLNGNQADYFEGDSVAYRMKFTDLPISSHTVTIGWDTTKGGKHALDYLTSYDLTETTDPCTGVSGCSGPANTYAIPADPNIPADSNWAGTQIPGNFSLFGGTITGVSSYTLVAPYTGDSETQITITFTPSVANPVLAWGGHIATRSDWGTNNSAISISGSPYHMRLRDLDGSGGNQDRSLASEAVIYPATITITKDAVPNDAQDFAFTTSGTELSSFSLDDDADIALSNTKVFTITTFVANNGDTKTITESAVSGWSLTNLVCDDANGSVNLGTRTATLSVTEGEIITCTFTNTQQNGHLIVQKTTVPAGSQQSFTINATGTGTITGGGAGSISDSTDQNYEVTTGTYSVTETVPTGWTETSNTCTGVVVAAGGTSYCTITNTQKGHIIVNKVTSGADDTFAFTTSGTGYSGFSLSNGQLNDQEVVPGSYTVSETALAGWSSDGGVCDNGETPGSLDVGAGETVTCTFTNTKLRNIQACKYNDHNGNGAKEESESLLDGWDMTLTPGNVTQTTVNGCTTFTNLSPGQYSVAETLKTDWSNTTPLSQNVTLTSSQNEIVYFGNFACATISGMKWEDLDGDGVKDAGEPALPDWTINLNGTVATDVTDANGEYSFKVCQAGTYTISETIPDTKVWYQTSPGGTSPNHQVDVTSGGTYTGKDFGNAKYAKIYGVKYRDNDGDGTLDANDLTATLSGWVFDLYDGTTNAVLGTYTTLSDGYYEFTGLLVNKTYYVLEQLKPGWTQTIGPTPTPTPFAVQSGETKQINFANFENMSVTVCKVEDADGSLTTTTDRTPVSGWQVDLLKNSQMYDNAQITGRDGCYTWTNLTPGSYSTQEESQTGWQHLGDTSHDFGTLENGHTYSHTFVNTHMGKIIVEKQTLPDGSTQSFGFTADYDANGFSLTDGQTNDSGYLMPGTYSIGETGVTGWDLTSATCSDQSNPNSINLSAGETVTCTFTNTQRGSISGVKYEDADGNDITIGDRTVLSGWTIELWKWVTDAFVDTGLTDTTDVNGYFSFENVTPGIYQLREQMQAGWTNVTPTSVDLTLVAGETDSGNNFVNTKYGTIVIVKQTLPDGSAEVFDFDLNYGDGDADLSDGQQDSTGNLVPGTYSVTENTPAGWDLTSATCSDNSNPSSISLQSGETVTCTFTNTKRGQIIVDKVTDPSGDTESFTFIPSYGSSFGLADADAPNNSGYLVPGTYSVSETVPSGWDLINTSCVSSIQDTETAGNLELDAGETITCTFTNQKDANIVVVKQTIPDGNSQIFDFDLSYGDGDADLSDGQSDNSGDLNPGTYSVSETAVAGWDLTSATCSDQSSPASISLQAGETVTCTFTNTQRGHLIVQKTTIPADDSNVFSILATGSGSITGGGAGSISDDTDKNYEVTPGTYSVSETVPGNWDQTGNTCSDVAIAAGETKTCEITNTKRGHVTVIKYYDHNMDGTKDPGDEVLGDTGIGTEIEATRWEIHLVGTDVDAYQWTGAQTAGQVTFSDLTPGAFTVSEQIKTGWLQSNISCGSETAIDNDNSHTVTVTAGQTTTCSIGNYEQGRIIVEKQTDPDGSKQDFDFTASYDESGFVLADGGQNDSGYLTPGLYSVSETEPSGWTNTSTVCTSSNEDAESADNLQLDPGETITCVFTNTERGRIIVDKITDPSGDPTSFEFTATGDDYENFNLADMDEPNDQSLLPGSYSVSETVPTGWDLSSASCDSSHEDSESADDMVLSAGEVITCTFTNTKRGTVIVTKYNDEDGNGFRGEGEDVLSDWTMNLNGDEEQETTNDNGEAVFENLLPGRYTLTEDLQKGWEQTQLSCGRNEDFFADDTADDTTDTGTFTLSPGETQRCVVGNHRLNPILTITKENNAAGDKAPGDSVLFTLTVTATQSAAYNVVVTDLPAGGFTYRAGSWTSNSTARGDLKTLGVTTEPTYHSPGVWNLGDMVMNETVTLTYIADISVDQKPGLYKDLAWAYGCKFETNCAVNDGNDVVALAVSPGYIDETNHVGTGVNVVKSTQNGATLNPTTGEVLGASTELPATGADEAWLTFAALLFLMGIGLITAGKYARRLHV